MVSYPSGVLAARCEDVASVKTPLIYLFAKNNNYKQVYLSVVVVVVGVKWDIIQYSIYSRFTG